MSPTPEITGYKKIEPNGTITTVAGGNSAGSSQDQLNQPIDVAVNAAGDLYISGFSNHRIQKFVASNTGAGSVTCQREITDSNATSRNGAIARISNHPHTNGNGKLIT